MAKGMEGADSLGGWGHCCCAMVRCTDRQLRGLGFRAFQMSKLAHSDQASMDKIELQARLDENPGSVVCGRCEGGGWGWWVKEGPAPCPNCDGEGIVKS